MRQSVEPSTPRRPSAGRARSGQVSVRSVQRRVSVPEMEHGRPSAAATGDGTATASGRDSSPAGELADLYFLTRADGELTLRLRQRKEADLLNAFDALDAHRLLLSRAPSASGPISAEQLRRRDLRRIWCAVLGARRHLVPGWTGRRAVWPGRGPADRGYRARRLRAVGRRRRGRPCPRHGRPRQGPGHGSGASVRRCGRRASRHGRGGSGLDGDLEDRRRHTPLGGSMTRRNGICAPTPAPGCVLRWATAGR